ncbi:hypothetical protein MYA_4336 [Burkholderia sp. KJ006]|nr:hypothetical protein MYA_4336 [Burkholderia sp. KJ006]
MPGAVLLCRPPFVEAPGWGLRSSRGGAPSSAGPPDLPRRAAIARMVAAVRENPASV